MDVGIIVTSVFIPAVAFLVRAVGGLEMGPSVKRLDDHIRFLPHAEGQNREMLGRLIQTEIRTIAEHDAYRLTRKVNGRTVTGTVVMAATAGPGSYLLWRVGAWWSDILAVVVTLIAIVYIGGVAGELFVEDLEAEEEALGTSDPTGNADGTAEA